MDENQLLSTAQVAAALGVGVSTVKRWVDEDILPAHRTPGGHRKLLLADVLRLVKEGRFPDLDLRKLIGVAADTPPAPDATASDLFAALQEGSEDDVRQVLTRAYLAGMPIVTLADQVIAPAMHRLGHAWEKGRIDVMHEHRGTQICAAALYELKVRVEEGAAALRPVALGAAPEGDPYFLSNLLVELVLLEAGWEPINLGPNTPLRSLEKGLIEYRPRLVWLSVSHLPDPEGFRRDYLRFHQAAERAGIPVALGGQALDASLRASLPYTTFGDGLAHLAAFARTLHPVPQRPQRGRPARRP